MSFLVSALNFLYDSLFGHMYKSSSVTRPVRFVEVDYDSIKEEAQRRIDNSQFIVKTEEDGGWVPVAIVRKLSGDYIHISLRHPTYSDPDIVTITRNHTGKLVARALYKPDPTLRVRIAD